MNASRWPWLVGLFVLVPTTALAVEPPDDSASMVVEWKRGEEISVSEILAVWARKFDALPVPGHEAQRVKVRFFSHTSQPMTWGTIKAILDINDVVVFEDQPTPNGPWLLRAHHRRVLSTKPLGGKGLTPGDAIPDREEYVTAVFQIQNGAGNTIFATLRGFATRDTNRINNILYVQGPELIIVADLASRVRYYASLIEALDVAGPRKGMKVFQLLFAPVQETATLIQNILSSMEGNRPPGGVIANAQQGGSKPQVFPDTRTNQLAVVAFPIDMPMVKLVIEEFDVRVPPSAGRLHVYECQNAKAIEVAPRIQDLFGGKRAGKGPGPAGPTLQGPPSLGEVQVNVVADEPTNSIIIQSDEQTRKEILAVLARLDRKARRVGIEVEVWEVSDNDQLAIGFELAGLTNAHEDSTRPSAASAFGLTDVGIANDANGNPTRISRTPRLASGITALLTRDTFDKIPIVMTALANYDESHLVTRSYTMTNNNKQATFSVTDSVPFSQSVVSQGGVVTPNVTFADASTALTITPQVNSDEYLTLKVGVTISSFSGSGSADLPPPTTQRQYDGEAITIPNGEYVVFGGLEQEIELTAEDKVPFLGDIPLLGHLFKKWRTQKKRTRVYIFVRPTILSDENFAGERRVGDYLRQKVQSERDEWLPALVPGRVVEGLSLQDEAFDVFGTGSGNPLLGG